MEWTRTSCRQHAARRARTPRSPHPTTPPDLYHPCACPQTDGYGITNPGPHVPAPHFMPHCHWAAPACRAASATRVRYCTRPSAHGGGVQLSSFISRHITNIYITHRRTGVKLPSSYSQRKPVRVRGFGAGSLHPSSLRARVRVATIPLALLDRLRPLCSRHLACRLCRHGRRLARLRLRRRRRRRRRHRRRRRPRRCRPRSRAARQRGGGARGAAAPWAAPPRPRRAAPPPLAGAACCRWPVGQG